MGDMGPYRTRLDVLQVTRPCTERWSAMEGTDAVRYCRICDSHVYDLSQLTRDEAEELLELTGASACVRFYRRADGTIATKDCEEDRSAHRRRRARRAAVAGAAAMLLAGAGAVGAAALPDPLPATRRAARRVEQPRTSAAPHRTWIDPEELPSLSDVLEPPTGLYTMGGAHLPPEEEDDRARLERPRITRRRR